MGASESRGKITGTILALVTTINHSPCDYADIWPSPTDKPMNMVSHEFGELVAEHYNPLYKFAFSLTRAEADASDLTQQTFYIWATKGHQLRERSKAKTWLFTTLYRTFLEGRRRLTRFLTPVGRLHGLGSGAGSPGSS